MYIKSQSLFTRLFPPGAAYGSLYSSSFLSYFQSSPSVTSTSSSSSAPPRPDLIYHEPAPAPAQPPPPPAPPPPPPPLPARNPDTCHVSQLSHVYPGPSIVYSHNTSINNYPLLRIASPRYSYGYSSLGSSGLSTPSRPRLAAARRPSLPSRVVSHEVNSLARLGHGGPGGGGSVASLVIETSEYVRDIKRRRATIHATLLRERAPGERLRRLLGLRIERRLVKALSTRRTHGRGGRNGDQARAAPGPRPRRGPLALLRQLTRRLSRPRRPRYVLGGSGSEDESSCSCPSLSSASTPRFIVDRRGAIRWPPIRLSEADPGDPGDGVDGGDGQAGADHLGIENFTLKKPQSSTTDPSADVPRVLGWLQVDNIYFQSSAIIFFKFYQIFLSC